RCHPTAPLFPSPTLFRSEGAFGIGDHSDVHVTASHAAHRSQFREGFGPFPGAVSGESESFSNDRNARCLRLRISRMGQGGLRVIVDQHARGDEVPTHTFGEVLRKGP